MARVPLMDQTELEPTHIQCYDCDELYPFEGEDGCPEEPESHGYEMVHATKEPLGYEDDNEYYSPLRQQYEYPAKEGTGR